MGTCKKCYQKEKCSERDQYGRCTKYRRIDEIKKEIEDLNQSVKTSEAESSKGKAPEKEGADGRGEDKN